MPILFEKALLLKFSKFIGLGTMASETNVVQRHHP
jgi:hypothetical protein